jgi:hypothetical protein
LERLLTQIVLNPADALVSGFPHIQIISSDHEIQSMAQSLKVAEEGVVEVERLLQEERTRNAILEDMIRSGSGDGGGSGGP